MCKNLTYSPKYKIYSSNDIICKRQKCGIPAMFVDPSVKCIHKPSFLSSRKFLTVNFYYNSNTEAYKNAELFLKKEKTKNYRTNYFSCSRHVNFRKNFLIPIVFYITLSYLILPSLLFSIRTTKKSYGHFIWYETSSFKIF